MVKVIRAWALLMAVLLPATLYAQEQPATEEPATETGSETEAAEESESDLAIGTEAGPRVGETYVVRDIQDWSMRCVK